MDSRPIFDGLISATAFAAGVYGVYTAPSRMQILQWSPVVLAAAVAINELVKRALHLVVKDEESCKAAGAVATVAVLCPSFILYKFYPNLTYICNAASITFTFGAGLVFALSSANQAIYQGAKDVYFMPKYFLPSSSTAQS